MTKDIQTIPKTLSYSLVFSRRAYEYFGVHSVRDGIGYTFRVFAPGADSVSVCGDFNGWDPHATPMQRVGEGGVWETAVQQELPASCKYKYFLCRGGEGCFKSDPFGFGAEKSQNAASVVVDPEYPWRDGGWLSYRKKCNDCGGGSDQTIHAYRVDPLWWRRHGDGSLYSWGDLASELIPYAKQMGYTHLELLGVIGGLSAADGIPDALFAPSPLQGEPWELMSLIDSAHEAGLGVLLDWNPYCFAAGEHGLECFDGTPLFERVGGEEDCRLFDLEKTEVLDFLTANALFWARIYHVDGLSVVPARKPWEGAEALLQELRARVRNDIPDVMLLFGGERNVKASRMGNEFGDVWTEGCERPLAWWLLDQCMHAEAQLSLARENHARLQNGINND